MKTYLYPANLQRSIRQLFWSLPVLMVLLMCVAGSIFLLAFAHFSGGVIFTIALAILTIRPTGGELTLLGYVRLASRYFFGQQSFFADVGREEQT